VVPPGSGCMHVSAMLSPWLHGIGRPLKRRLLEWRAAAATPEPWRPIPIVHRPLPSADAVTCIVMHKERGRIREIAAHADWLETRHGFSTAWRRLAAILDLVADGRVGDGAWAADLSDWVRQPGPVIGFCSNRGESLLIPDRGFHSTRGYRRERRLAARAPRFMDRDPRIVWRGSPSGAGQAVFDPLVPDAPHMIQRVRMCLLLRDDPMAAATSVDARIAVGRRMPPDRAAAYRRVGIAGERVAQDSWSRRRFAIDIDGHANAFSNLFIRLIFGCCVIKVASPAGFRQWYYDRIEPWTHFVPVADDLSDLVDVVAWCQGHPRACERIAAEGQRAALAMTFASERDAAIEMLGAREGAAADRGILPLPRRDVPPSDAGLRRAA